GHASVVEQGKASDSGPLRLLRRGPGHAPTYAVADPDRRGRTDSARLSPRGDTGTRLVWIRARRGGDAQERGRAARGGQEVSTPGGAGHAGDQRDAARLRCSRS